MYTVLIFAAFIFSAQAFLFNLLGSLGGCGCSPCASCSPCGGSVSVLSPPPPPPPPLPLEAPAPAPPPSYAVAPQVYQPQASMDQSPAPSYQPSLSYRAPYVPPQSSGGYVQPPNFYGGSRNAYKSQQFPSFIQGIVSQGYQQAPARQFLPAPETAPVVSDHIPQSSASGVYVQPSSTIHQTNVQPSYNAIKEAAVVPETVQGLGPERAQSEPLGETMLQPAPAQLGFGQPAPAQPQSTSAQYQSAPAQVKYEQSATAQATYGQLGTSHFNNEPKEQVQTIYEQPAPAATVEDKVSKVVASYIGTIATEASGY